MSETQTSTQDARQTEPGSGTSGQTEPGADAGGETGSWFPVPGESELPSELQRLFAKARERLGFVPNVFRVYAFRPQRLSAWFSHFRLLHEPTDGLSAADREMVAVVVSAANGCLYCLVAHGAALRDQLGDPVLGERISYDWRRADLDGRRRAICAYAEKLTLSPREVTRDDLQALLDAGLSTEEAWDVAELAAMYNLTNRMAMATNMLPNAEYSGQARPR
ncbi:MAG TPA: peroxidase-related enzyme [Solirubrobacteraceae bacterium]|nr:peroxidase-related enzyme [Solirubrobacteraceae bacterium]